MKARMAVGVVVASLAVGMAVAQEKPAPKASAGGGVFVIADCTAFKDKTLSVKFRMDENFDQYIAAKFTYPLAEAKGAEAGKTYVFTFKGDEAAHTVEKLSPVDEKDPPKDLGDHSLIGKVVSVDEKSAVVEFVRDENVKRFFSREQNLKIWNDKLTFAAGQVLRIGFGPDNRHCQGYKVIEEPKKQ